jgi:hypothetical protein
MSDYGFAINLTGDAAKKMQGLTNMSSVSVKSMKELQKATGLSSQKLNEFGASGKRTSGLLNTMVGDTNKLSSGFRDMFAAFSLSSLALQGIGMIKDGIVNEIKETEKAGIEFEKSRMMIKLFIQDVAGGGEATIKAMDRVSESSKLFTATQINNASQILMGMGISISSYKYMGDLEAAATGVGRSIKTGMTRGVIDLNVELSKSDPAGNFALVLESMGKRANASAEYMKTLSGHIKEVNTEIEKIRVEAGAGFWTKLGLNIKESWVEMLHPVATVQVQFKENMQNQYDELTKGKTGLDTVKSIQSQYKMWGEQYKKAIERGDSQIQISNIKRYFDFYIDKLKEVVGLKNQEKNINDRLKEDAPEGGYSELSEKITNAKSALMDKFADFYNGKGKAPSSKEIANYTKLLTLQHKIEDKFKGLESNSNNTTDITGASGGLGQAKVINIRMDAVQKIYSSDNKDLKQYGQDAVEVIIRLFQNMAQNASSVV